MKKICFAVLAVFALTFVSIYAAQAQAPSATAGASDLAGQCAKLDAEKADLVKEKDRLLAEKKSQEQEDTDLKAAVRRLKDSKVQFKMDADELQGSISRYNTECGGSHPRSVYEQLRPKCEPWGEFIDRKNRELDKKASEFPTAQQNIDSRQAKLTRDTASLAGKIKDNDAKISDLAAKLKELQSRAIAAALKDPRSRKKAGTACQRMSSEEALHCCNSVVWDGADPRTCDVSLVYQVFETGGMFGTRVVVPVR